MQADIGNLKITKLVGVVPKNVSYFDDEISNYNHDIESSNKLKKIMGYNQHHVVMNDSTVSDMAILGFEELLSKGLDADSIDALIVITQTPDYQIPSTSSVLHGALGLKKDCYCVDINDGCAGFIKGLFEASSFLRNTDSKRVLLITGDVLSRKVSRRDRNSFPLVGDAVTLCIINRVINEEIYSPLELKFDGTGCLALNIPAGGSKLNSSNLTNKYVSDSEGNIRCLDNLVMKGRDVFTFTQTTVLSFLNDFLSKHNSFSPELYFFHQANTFILDRFRKALKVNDSQLPSEVISLYGNSSSATIPLSIILHFQNLNESFLKKQIMLAGFGVGLSWGAAILFLEDLDFCKLIEGEF